MAKQKDFLTEYLNSFQEQLNRLETKQDRQTDKLESIERQTLKTNGRVNRAESDIKRMENKLAERVPVINSKTLYLIALGSVVFLFIIAKALHVNLGGLSL